VLILRVSAVESHEGAQDRPPDRGRTSSNFSIRFAKETVAPGRNPDVQRLLLSALSSKFGLAIGAGRRRFRVQSS